MKELLIMLIIFASPLLSAIYFDQGEKVDLGIYSDYGAYKPSVKYLVDFAKDRGFTYINLTEKDLRGGRLDKVKLIIFPGGWAGDYDEYGNKGYGSLPYDAISAIRNFVAKGGSYLGICAGAYFASKFIIWENNSYRGKLSLFDGSSIGPINEIAEWPNYNWTRVLVNNNYLSGITNVTAFYWGGPYFKKIYSNFSIIERYAINSKPATIFFKYGRGNVVLTGIHHEWVCKINPEWTITNWNILQELITKFLIRRSSRNNTYFQIFVILLALILIPVIMYFKRGR